MGAVSSCRSSSRRAYNRRRVSLRSWEHSQSQSAGQQSHVVSFIVFIVACITGVVLSICVDALVGCSPRGSVFVCERAGRVFVGDRVGWWRAWCFVGAG